MGKMEKAMREMSRIASLSSQVVRVPGSFCGDGHHLGPERSMKAGHDIEQMVLVLVVRKTGLKGSAELCLEVTSAPCAVDMSSRLLGTERLR